MHDIDTENQFIQLRAKGQSLAKIAAQINVCQRTLVEWNHKHHAEIQSLRAMAFEAFKEQVLTSREQELVALNNRLQRIDKEIAQRTIRFVPVASLCRLSAMLRSEIHNFSLPPDPLPPLQGPLPIQQTSPETK